MKESYLPDLLQMIGIGLLQIIGIAFVITVLSVLGLMVWDWITKDSE